MPHFHLSLQAGDDMILKRMKRRHSRADAVRTVERIKAARPDATIGADLIAGFPTETEDMALNSLRLLDDCDVVAAAHLPLLAAARTRRRRACRKSPRELVKARAAGLREAAAERRTRWLDSLVGSDAARPDRGRRQGHSDNFAPICVDGAQARRKRNSPHHRPLWRSADGGLGMSWLDRLRGGFSKTAERVADNLTGLTSRAALDTATLDDIEEALIASDLGPEASHRIREAIAAQKFEQLDERGLRTILAEEIEKILAPVAKPLEVWGFPRPHVILVIGVNGSGKTTTIGKLGALAKEQDYGVLLAAGDTFRAAAIEQLQIWGERIGAPVIAGKEGGDAAGIVFDGVKQATADRRGRADRRHCRATAEQDAPDGGADQDPPRARPPQPRSAARCAARARCDHRPERPCPSRGVSRERG